MKNIMIIICLTCALSFASAQETKVIDTIYANEMKTVSLFFPDPIRQGITGSANFAFSYNRDREQYFGLLQATPGEESNLLVVTNNGTIYSFLLQYSPELEKLNYFIPVTESIGNERTGSSQLPNQEVLAPIQDSLTVTLKTPDFHKLCTQLLRNPRPFDQIMYREGITLQMTKSIYYANEVYVVLEIQNLSEIDYEIDSLDLYKINGNNNRKASYQELPIDPIFQFNFPEVVRKGETIQFVLVYPKFTLGNRERVLIKLRELNGGRDVVVRLRR